MTDTTTKATNTRTVNTGHVWQCPTCQATVTVWPDAKEVGHRCPRKVNKWVEWKQVGE